MQWTWYLEDCMQLIDSAREVENDVLLVQLVKLRLIAGRLYDLQCSGSTNVGTKAPMLFHLKSFQAQLRSFKENIPVQLRSNGEAFRGSNISNLC